MNFEEYLRANASAHESLKKKEIEAFAKHLSSLSNSKAFLWVAGNGGAASTASHAVADFNKTIFGQNQKSIKTVSITEMTSLTTAFANDIDFNETISGPLSLLARESDTLLVISVSGTSPNITSALEFARLHHMTTMCIFGENGRENARQVNFPIVVNSFDYQVVENVQLFLVHWIVKFLTES
jgi:D-sedoheptulose 7-phosphate isomerase